MTTTSTSTLEDARARIDEINRRVVELLAERQAIVDELCAIKADNGQSVRDPEREAELLDDVRSVAEEAGLPPDLAETLFEEILDHSVRRQRRLRGAEAEEEGEESSANAAEAAARQPRATSPNGQTPSSRRRPAETTARPDGETEKE